MPKIDDDLLLARRLRYPPPFVGSAVALLISNATSLAPRVSVPRSAPMAPVMQEYRSDPVPAITRAVNVEALEFMLGVKDELRYAWL